jgi:hypothetical protein
MSTPTTHTITDTEKEDLVSKAITYMVFIKRATHMELPDVNTFAFNNPELFKCEITAFVRSLIMTASKSYPIFNHGAVGETKDTVYHGFSTIAMLVRNISQLMGVDPTEEQHELVGKTAEEGAWNFTDNLELNPDIRTDAIRQFLEALTLERNLVCQMLHPIILSAYVNLNFVDKAIVSQELHDAFVAHCLKYPPSAIFGSDIRNIKIAREAMVKAPNHGKELIDVFFDPITLVLQLSDCVRVVPNISADVDRMRETNVVIDHKLFQLWKDDIEADEGAEEIPCRVCRQMSYLGKRVLHMVANTIAKHELYANSLHLYLTWNQLFNVIIGTIRRRIMQEDISKREKKMLMHFYKQYSSQIQVHSYECNNHHYINGITHESQCNGVICDLENIANSKFLIWPHQALVNSQKA